MVVAMDDQAVAALCAGQARTGAVAADERSAGGELRVEAQPRLTVAVVARSPAVVAGLSELLRRDGIAALDSEGANLETLSEAADVLVIDLDNAGDAATEIEALDVPAVLLSGTADFEPGGRDYAGAARGWLARDASAEELAAAVRAVAAGLDVVGPGVAPAPGRGELAPGESPLTEREREVLQLVAAGLPNKGIARELGISEHTVKFHVGALLSKLQAQSRTEAVSIAARRGVLAL
jgi:DNA-binding NarL/FixJ family response regulator